MAKKSAKNLPLLISFTVIAALGIGLLVGGILLVKKYNNADETDAEVIKVEWRYDYDDNDRMYCPTYRYYVDGKQYIVKSNIWSNTRYVEGSTVKIRYNRDNPEKLVTSSTVGIILCCTGGVLCAAGVGLAFKFIYGACKKRV